MDNLNNQPKEETSTGNEKQSIFTKETLGVVLVLFATLCLVCLITRDAVFSVPGEMVNSFLFGLFGYFAYLVMLGVILFGITLITGKKIEIDGKITLFSILSLISIDLLLHVITTHGFAGDYGEYLSTSYLMASQGGILTCSGGGIVTALVAYVFPLILGYTGSYVILSILIALFVTFTVKAIVDIKKAQSSNDKPLIRTSFVKTESSSADMPNISFDGEKDYPVDIGFSTQSNGVQKLFVVNASKDAFKTQPKNKDGETTVKLNLGHTQGGLGVVSTTTSYTQNYANDIQSKIDYIKTPAPIDIEGLNDNSNVVKGGYYQSAPQTNVSDYIPQTPTTYVEPQQETPPHVNNIPLFRHDETPEIDDAQSHADRFSRFADFNESEQPAKTYSQTEEPTEIERPVNDIFSDNTPKPTNPFNFDQIKHVEEPEQEDLVQPDVFDFSREQKPQEQNPVEDVFEKPTETTVARERVRNIFFDTESKPEPVDPTVEPTTPEPPAYTSRVEADNNLGSIRRRGFTPVEPEPQPIPEPIVEEQKPPKPAPPVNREYFRPPFDLLSDYRTEANVQGENHEENMAIIKQTLAEFHIDVETETYVQGPSITRYEIKMPAGVSVKKVLSFDEDLRMRLSSKEGVRIEAPIPGKNLVGIEIANKVPQMVGLKEVMELSAKNGPSKPGSLMFAIGKDIVGNAVTDNLAKGPHYLVAGSTGSGKSVCLNTMIVSLIMRYSPEELRLFLVDPKGVEFATYEHLPHLMIDEIITAPQKTIEMLKWAYTEMERRFLVFRECNAGIVNIDDYNANLPKDVAKMPRIVIIIDELADLMQTCKRDLEPKICAIAQKARSAGIHLVLATQRPSVDVITGLIKANLPSRIGFKVLNMHDSITILSEAGAEKLLGNGDMLYKNANMPGCVRYQGAYIHMREVNNVVNYIKEHNTAYFDDELQDYLEKAANPQPTPTPTNEGPANANGGEYSDLFIRAIWFGVNSGTISISSIQRRFGVGFSKAGAIMDKIDRMGFVAANEPGKSNGKPRKVLLSREDCEAKFGPQPPEEYL